MKCLFAALGSCLTLASARAQVVLPWHFDDATSRTVYRIEASQAAGERAVTLPAPADSATLALIDAAAPGTLLPIHLSTNGATLLLPGETDPARPRHLLAYTGGRAHSPLLSAPPVSVDFAQAVLKRSWDFEDGTPCGITSWGNGPSHLGPITVTNGWLRIPVKGTDPYLIFGDMFGPPASPRGLRIDSSAYRYLELRLRQSCQEAEWEFYVTDSDGLHKSCKFSVAGTAPQTFLFDLRACFPDFWDGRLFRALRLDTTNNRKDVLAEVDAIRILPQPPKVTSGPTLSREAVRTRAGIAAIRPSFPRSLTAGLRHEAKVETAGVEAPSRVTWSLIVADSRSVIAGTAAAVPLPAFTRAGDYAWTFGPADDLGEPLNAASGTLHVDPAALASYRLTPEKEYLDLAAPSATLSICGLDRFGNPLPVDIQRPRWGASGNLRFPEGRLKGAPASLSVSCPSDSPATYRLTLEDGMGHGGAAVLTTVSYRKDTLRITPSGYLATPSGTLFFPSGGLYANWPHRLHADGTVSRALDLFPCGPTPYSENYPWSPKTEAAVAAYLKHCSERGINCLRLMLRNMDLVGRVDSVQLQATLHLFDLARPFGIRFNVALFEDYDKPPYVSPAILEKIALPHYTPETLAALPPHRARFLVRKDTLASAAMRYSDSDAIACQKDYLRELIPVLAAREEVLCYELENEMVFPPMSWCREIAAFIRTVDPHTLILGNPGPHDWPEPLRWRDSGCDLFSFHPYNDGQFPADHGALVYLRSKFAAQAGVPMYTGEGGLNQNRWQKGVKQISPEASARGARDQIWMSVCCGAAGCLYWTLNHDLEAREFAAIQPAFEALGLDLKTLKRQRPSVALALPPKQRDRRDAALAMRLLSLGADFDTVESPASGTYAVSVDPERQTPETLTLPATVASPAAGWQVATLLSDKQDQALLYFRNIAGGVKDFGAPPRPCFLREVQPSEAVLTLRAAWRTVTAFDLDTRQTTAVVPDAAGRVSLGLTSHDFLIALRR